MKLIVIIPAYNEERTIGAVVRSIPRQTPGISQTEVYVLDDGSKDNTAKAAASAGADKVISSGRNMGLAKTFSRGLDAALLGGGEIIVNIDGDNQFDANEIPRLIEPIIRRRADLVVGDRQVRNRKEMPWGNRYGNLFGDWILKRLTGSEINDFSCGFRAFSRSLAMQLNINSGYTYTHETIIQAIYKNLAIANMPITVRPRPDRSSRLINNLFTHIKKSSSTIIRSVLMYKPLKTLFYFGLLIMFPGILLGLRHIYLSLAGAGGSRIQSLILSAILILMGFFTIILGLLGDLIARNRKLNEEILLLLKKRQYDENGGTDE